MIRIKRIVESRELDMESMESGENLDFSEIFDEEILDDLIEMVGSEEEVESAAEACYNELVASFEENEFEISDDMVPEQLAIAALVVKLVEQGKLDPNDAEDFLQYTLG
jgi:hypothetical protein